MDLYDQPTNLFVAKFLGVANVVEGTAVNEKGKTLFRSSDGAITGSYRGILYDSDQYRFSRPQNLTVHSSDVESLPGMPCLFDGLSFFLYGMEKMSEGMKKSASNKMRSVLAALTQKPDNKCRFEVCAYLQRSDGLSI